jgi:aspartate aminotransferase
VRAFQGGSEIEHYLWLSRRILAALGNYITQALSSAGVKVSKPHGAFYLFPDFCEHREKLAARDIRSSDQLCQALLNETGVAILPGSHFGRPASELTARLAYVDFDGARAIEAAEQYVRNENLDEDFLTAFAKNTIDAVDIMVSWIHNYLATE